MKTAIPKGRPFSAQASRLPEPAEPQEIVVYFWGRIFAALFVLFLVVGGIIWGAFEIFGTGEQKDALVENQSVEAPASMSETASEAASETPSSESTAEPASLPAPAAGESEPSPEDATSIKLLSDHLIRAQLSTGLEDERVARVEIRPSVDPMRASSAKYIDRHMLGDWRVEVVTEEGELLAKGAFSVLPQ